MALARVLVGKELRARWRGLILLGLLAAVWAAAAMTAIAGGRRTASVVDRFQRVTAASHATYTIADAEAEDALLEALRAAPEVAAVDSLWNASSGIGFDRGLWAYVIVGVENVWGREFDRPIVVRGRLPDPASVTEVTVSQAMADFFDVDVGDHLSLPMWDHDEWQQWHELRGAYPPFNGPLIDVLVVGIDNRALDLGAAKGDGLGVTATPAFFERWGAAIGANPRQVVVTFHDPEFDANGLAQRLTEGLGAQVDATTDAELYADNLRDSAGALTVGLAVLAIAVLVTGGLVVGLAVAREVRRAAVAYEPLRALGATRWQRIGALSMPIAIAGIVSALVAIVAAGMASSLFPLGAAGDAEPDRGVWLDAPVLAGGLGIVVFMVSTAAIVQLRPFQSRSRSAAARGWRPSLLASLGPAATVGVVNAIGSRRARSSIVIAAVTIAGLTAAGWFHQSMDDLGDRPDRWGYTWSSSPEIGVPSEEFDALINQLVLHDDVASVSYLELTTVSMADSPVDLFTFSRRSGELFAPVVLAGRLPSATFEIAVGEATARGLNIQVGDTVVVASPFAASHECQVVGIVVPPYNGTGSNLGSGAYAHVSTFAQMNLPSAVITVRLAVGYEPNVDEQLLHEQLTDLGFRFEARSLPRAPRAIANVVGVLVIVKWLLVFFLIQGLLATVLAAARRGTTHARDGAILRTLGFSNRDMLRAALIETTTIIAIGLATGVALGLVAGAKAWRLATAELGVVDAMTTAMPIVVGIAGLALVGAGSVSVAVSRAATGRERSYQLRES